MAGNRTKIKARIKSVNATRKITGAMNLIANVKFQKEKTLFDQVLVYSRELKKTASRILSAEYDFRHPFLSENGAEKDLYYYIGSDLGMCGSYNVTLSKYLEEHVPKDALLYVLGSHQYNHIRNEGYEVLNELSPSDPLERTDLKILADEALKKFLNGEVRSVNLIYTRFVNTVTYEPVIERLIPVSPAVGEKRGYTYLEPDPVEVLDHLIPLMTETAFYSAHVEAKVAEQAARRMAMDNATKNAAQLVEKLTLEYNQARQAAITQEITEIIGGADAL